MKVSNAGLDLIRKFELCKLSPYLDIAGVPTIGWGTTIYPSGKHVTMQDPSISQFQADCYLEYSAGKVADAVTMMVSDKIKQNQFDALVSFAYNVGVPGLHGSTLLKAVQWDLGAIDGYNHGGVRAAFLMWDKTHIDGKLVEVSGLKVRRNAEADLYLS
jgi:lysozyme